MIPLGVKLKIDSARKIKTKILRIEQDNVVLNRINLAKLSSFGQQACEQLSNACDRIINDAWDRYVNNDKKPNLYMRFFSNREEFDSYFARNKSLKFDAFPVFIREFFSQCQPFEKIENAVLVEMKKIAALKHTEDPKLERNSNNHFVFGGAGEVAYVENLYIDDLGRPHLTGGRIRKQEGTWEAGALDHVIEITDKFSNSGMCASSFVNNCIERVDAFVRGYYIHCGNNGATVLERRTR